MNINEAIEIWDQRNNAGDGYPVGHETDTPSEAVDREGWTQCESDCTGRVLAEDNIGRIVLVCDAEGPWGCTVG